MVVAPAKGRSGLDHRPGAGTATTAPRKAANAYNNAMLQAKDLTSQSSGFMVEKRGATAPQECKPVNHPVHTQIRAIGPQLLHHAK